MKELTVINFTKICLSLIMKILKRIWIMSILIIKRWKGFLFTKVLLIKMTKIKSKDLKMKMKMNEVLNRPD